MKQLFEREVWLILHVRLIARGFTAIKLGRSLLVLLLLRSAWFAKLRKLATLSAITTILLSLALLRCA